jgi:cysteinyl-tRNA synthetase
MPKAVEVLSEAVSADIPDGDKYALLASWDSVLGLDLERAVREGAGGLPQDVQDLIAERDAARASRDFAKSDEIRDRLAAMGFEVMDTAEGTRVRRRD